MLRGFQLAGRPSSGGGATTRERNMRDLQGFELGYVSGGGGSYSGSCGCYCPSPSKPKRAKNNNGYGNGPESGPAPGNSGKTGGGKNENFGPRGPR